MTCSVYSLHKDGISQQGAVLCCAVLCCAVLCCAVCGEVHTGGATDDQSTRIQLTTAVDGWKGACRCSQFVAVAKCCASTYFAISSSAKVESDVESKSKSCVRRHYQTDRSAFEERQASDICSAESKLKAD